MECRGLRIVTGTGSDLSVWCPHCGRAITAWGSGISETMKMLRARIDAHYLVCPSIPENKGCGTCVNYVTVNKGCENQHSICSLMKHVFGKRDCHEIMMHHCLSYGMTVEEMIKMINVNAGYVEPRESCLPKDEDIIFPEDYQPKGDINDL